jgi:hypothetical protein
MNSAHETIARDYRFGHFLPVSFIFLKLCAFTLRPDAPRRMFSAGVPGCEQNFLKISQHTTSAIAACGRGSGYFNRDCGSS